MSLLVNLLFCAKFDAGVFKWLLFSGQTWTSRKTTFMPDINQRFLAIDANVFLPSN